MRVTNHTDVTAETVCELLRKIAALDLGVPITLVLDNARYQRCALVQNLARELHIELLFLPSYSPNLNLIERLWKFTKKKALHCRHHSNYMDFHTAINACLDQLTAEYQEEIRSLMTPTFQRVAVEAIHQTEGYVVKRTSGPMPPSLYVPGRRPFLGSWSACPVPAAASIMKLVLGRVGRATKRIDGIFVDGRSDC